MVCSFHGVPPCFYRTIHKLSLNFNSEALHRVQRAASLYAYPMSELLYQILVSLKTAPPEGLPAGFNVHVLPEGRFQARDGRPGNIRGSKARHFVLDKPAALAMVEKIKTRQSAMVVDYEHQSEYSRNNGAPAPAAGWVKDAMYLEGSGIWLSVEWTEKAKAMIAADEYRYISPVMLFNLNSGQITELINLALTNNPALDGLQAVLASFQPAYAGFYYLPSYSGLMTEKEGFNIVNGDKPQTNNEGKAMEELLKQLRAALGLGEDADQAGILAAIKALQQKGEGLSFDASKFAPVEALAALQNANGSLQQELAALRAQVSGSQLAAQVDAALADGRLLPPMKEWALKLGQENPEALSAYLKAAVPVAALTGKQTDGQPSKQGKAALSSEDRYVMEHLGISEEDFLKTKEAK